MSTINVAPAALDLVLYGGDTFRMQVTFTDKETGAPWPLTGGWLAQARDSTGALIATFATYSTGAPGGNVLAVELTSDDTTAIANARGVAWDLQNEAPPIGSGDVRTWFRGKVSANTDITRVP